MTGSASTKSMLLEQIDREWDRFVEVARGVSGERAVEPGAVGHWSLREALLHVAAWDEELVKLLEEYRRSGEQHDYGDDAAIDDLNERQVEERRSLDLRQAWEYLEKAHAGAIDFLHGLPEETFDEGTYTRGQITTETLGHYQQHREDLERWKASRS